MAGLGLRCAAPCRVPSACLSSPFLPHRREPRGERPSLAEGLEAVFDRLVVAPDHIGEAAVGDAGFDVGAVQAEDTFAVEAVGAAGHRALGVDEAGLGFGVEQGAGHRFRRLGAEGGEGGFDAV